MAKSNFEFFRKLADAGTNLIGAVPRVGAYVIGAVNAVVSAVQSVLQLGVDALESLADKLDDAYTG